MQWRHMIGKERERDLLEIRSRRERQGKRAPNNYHTTILENSLASRLQKSKHFCFLHFTNSVASVLGHVPLVTVGTFFYYTGNKNLGDSDYKQIVTVQRFFNMALVETAIASDYRGNVTEREVTVGECDCTFERYCKY